MSLPGLVSSPRPIHMDALETIPTYTADGDGGDVEVEDVTDTLVRYEHLSLHARFGLITHHL